MPHRLAHAVLLPAGAAPTHRQAHSPRLPSLSCLLWPAPQDGAAQRTKATTPLIKDARRAILLSGTPALNKPKEIFQQARALLALLAA